MKILFSLASIFLLAASAQASPAVKTGFGSDVVVTSAHLGTAPGGGTYVSGISEPALGISAPAHPHLHITAYDRKGDILVEKIEVLNRSDLTVNHYFPRPRATYTAYLPVDASQISRITITPHSGHRHAEAKNLKIS